MDLLIVEQLQDFGLLFPALLASAKASLRGPWRTRWAHSVISTVPAGWRRDSNVGLREPGGSVAIITIAEELLGAGGALLLVI